MLFFFSSGCYAIAFSVGIPSRCSIIILNFFCSRSFVCLLAVCSTHKAKKSDVNLCDFRVLLLMFRPNRNDDAKQCVRLCAWKHDTNIWSCHCGQSNLHSNIVPPCTLSRHVSFHCVHRLLTTNKSILENKTKTLILFKKAQKSALPELAVCLWLVHFRSSNLNKLVFVSKFCIYAA